MAEVTINGLIQVASTGIDSDTPIGTAFVYDDDPAATGLISTLNGLVFDTGDAFGQLIPIGSTTVIDGTEYSLTSIFNSNAIYDKTDPDTGESFQQEGQTVSFTLEDSDGNVLTYMAPSNQFNVDDPWVPGIINSIEISSPPTPEDTITAGVEGDESKLSDDKEVEIPCFVAGTLIDTADGRRLVEDLKPGDLVLTRDKGYLPLQWVGQRALADNEIVEQPEFAAVILRAGALGPNMPERDTRVSPSHRVLVFGPRAELLFGENEVLVPAGHLVGMPGIERDTGAVTYVHIMFDSHQIVLGDGLWSESFQPADYSLDGLGAAQRDEILTLFPDLAEKGSARKFKAARMTLRQHEARLLFAA